MLEYCLPELRSPFAAVDKKAVVRYLTHDAYWERGNFGEWLRPRMYSWLATAVWWVSVAMVQRTVGSAFIHSEQGWTKTLKEIVYTPGALVGVWYGINSLSSVGSLFCRAYSNFDGISMFQIYIKRDCKRWSEGNVLKSMLASVGICAFDTLLAAHTSWIVESCTNSASELLWGRVVGWRM